MSRAGFRAACVALSLAVLAPGAHAAPAVRCPDGRFPLLGEATLGADGQTNTVVFG